MRPNFPSFHLRFFTFLALLAALWARPLAAAPITASDRFVRTGAAESITAPLAAFGGTTTVQPWSGLIEVVVSGTGSNFAGYGGATDAFYYYFSPGGIDVHIAERDDQNWGLHVSSEGCAAALECEALSVLEFTVFSEGVGSVLPLTGWIPGDVRQAAVMPYRADHLYRFVIDVGPEAEVLTFGYGDGGVFDNSGQFTIALYGVSIAIPEPSPLAFLLLISLGLLRFGFRAQRG